MFSKQINVCNAGLDSPVQATVMGKEGNRNARAVAFHSCTGTGQSLGC